VLTAAVLRSPHMLAGVDFGRGAGERVLFGRCREAGAGGNACAGKADMHGRRGWYRKLALIQLAVALALAALDAAQIAIVTSLMIAIIFAMVSLRVRNYL
jgi:hypothetical protein